MHIGNVDPRLARPSEAEASRAIRGVAIAVIAALSLSVFLSELAPDPFEWLLLSILSLLGALILSGVAALRREPTRSPVVTHWDGAGLLALVGFGAALIGDYELIHQHLQAAETLPKSR